MVVNFSDCPRKQSAFSESGVVRAHCRDIWNTVVVMCTKYDILPLFIFSYYGYVREYI